MTHYIFGSTKKSVERKEIEIFIYFNYLDQN